MQPAAAAVLTSALPARARQDVYAFGVMMWELYTNQAAFQKLHYGARQLGGTACRRAVDGSCGCRGAPLTHGLERCLAALLQANSLKRWCCGTCGRSCQPACRPTTSC